MSEVGRALDSAAWSLARDHVRPGETILWSARPSLVGIIPILLSGGGAVVAITLAAWFGVEDPTSFLRGTPALVLAVGGVLVQTVRRFVKLRFTTFVITDKRIYSISSFLETDARSIPLARASGVSVKQGVFGRVLGFWNGRIATYGEEGRALDIPAIRDGEGLLREASTGLRRGANVAWLRRGD
jgi:uncharacterized membrane protein YdbT with pleckstrin-like domain